MAQDDPDFKHLHEENSVCKTSSKSNDNPMPLADKTNLPSNPSSPGKKSSSNSDENQTPIVATTSKCDISIEFPAKDTPRDDQDSQLSSTVCEEGMPPSVCGACGGSGNGGRWDKSLGVLCQKFVMLFLITPVSHAHNRLILTCTSAHTFMYT